jgi:Rad3-related DNA helicase
MKTRIPSPEDLGFDPVKFPSFRRYPGFSQWEVAKKVVLSDKRIIGMQGPPGVGKSATYMLIARLLGIDGDGKGNATANGEKRGLVLTSTKAQQSQLMNDFHSTFAMEEIKGRQNYNCREWKGTCDSARAQNSICRREQRGYGCPYQEAVNRARLSPIPVGNNAFWLTLGTYGDPFAIGQFDLLICDEAHNLVDSLTDAATIELKQTELALAGLKLPYYETVNEWRKWSAEVKSDVRKSADETSNESSHGRRLRKLADTLTRISHLPPHGWTFPEQVVSGGPSVSFCPVWPEERAEELLFRKIPKIVLTSATLYPSIRQQLAIPKNDFEWIEVSSSYPAKNRPLIYINSSPEIRVDFRMGEGEKRLLITKIDAIISKWKKFKGVIHCRSYAYQELLLERSKFSSLMLAPNPRKGLTVADAIADFKNLQTGILISPSVEEGYNFPDSDCRWQIILKVPFLDSRTPLMAERKKTNKRYATDLVSSKVLQQSLRHVRSEKDWGVTFIVDAHWVYFQKQGYFPRYSRLSMKKMPTVPTPEELGFK